MNGNATRGLLLAALAVAASGAWSQGLPCGAYPVVGMQSREVPPFDSTPVMCEAAECSTHYGSLLLTMTAPTPEWVRAFQSAERQLLVAYAGTSPCGYMQTMGVERYIVQCTLTVVDARDATHQFGGEVYNLVPLLPRDKVSAKIWAGTGFSGGEIDTVHGEIWARLEFACTTDLAWVDSVVEAHVDTIGDRLVSGTWMFPRAYQVKGTPAAIRDFAFVEGVMYAYETDTTYYPLSCRPRANGFTRAGDVATTFDLRGRLIRSNGNASRGAGAVVVRSIAGAKLLLSPGAFLTRDR